MQTDRTVPSFDIVVDNRGTTRTISPRGEIDMATTDTVRQALSSALADGVETLVLDLGETTFVDSSAMALIVGVAERVANADVRLVVLPGPPEVRRVFEICGLDQLVPFARNGDRVT